MTTGPLPLGPEGVAAPALPDLPSPGGARRLLGVVEGGLFYGLLIVGFVLPIGLIIVGALRG